MRKIFCLGTVVLSSAFFLACLEEEAMPVPFPLPPPSAQTTDTALPPPVEKVEPTPVAATPKAASTPTSPPASTLAFIPVATDAEQLKSGRYTIQVAVFPSEASARKLVKKITENGINAYYVKVNNPAQLLGTYYRVRVGYFNGKTAAETFAKTRLEPLGYAWYVDGRRNDAIGNPNLAAASVESVAPVAPVASSTSANSELEKAKQEYKEIAKQAQAAKQATPPAPPPPKAPPKAPPPPPPPPKAAQKVVEPPSNW